MERSHAVCNGDGRIAARFQRRIFFKSVRDIKIIDRAGHHHGAIASSQVCSILSNDAFFGALVYIFVM